VNPPINTAGVVSQLGSIPAALQSVASAVPVESFTSVAQFATLPVSVLLSPLMSLAQSANGAGLAGAAGVEADVPTLAGGVTSGVAPVSGGGLGSAISASVGAAHALGAMSVPPSWAGSVPARLASSAVSGLGAAPSGAATVAATAGVTGGPGGMPMMPVPMGGAGAGAQGGMLGRGGGGPHVMQQRPSVIPRTGVG
jgi:PPE-SVP subfamily C-terminal region